MHCDCESTGVGFILASDHARRFAGLMRWLDSQAIGRTVLHVSMCKTVLKRTGLTGEPGPGLYLIPTLGIRTVIYRLG